MLNNKPSELMLKSLKALSNESRLRILVWLKTPSEGFPTQTDGSPIQDGICADFIRERLGVSAPTASRHLTILTDAGLLVATRKKGWTFYRRNDEALSALAQAIGEAL